MARSTPARRTRSVAVAVAIALGATACAGATPATAPTTAGTTGTAAGGAIDAPVTVTPGGTTTDPRSAPWWPADPTAPEAPLDLADAPAVTVPTWAVPPAATGDLVPGAGVVEVRPGDDLASLARSRPPGTTFLIRPGVHRVRDVSPLAGQRFLGDAGAVLNGAREVGGWRDNGDGRWVTDDVGTTAARSGQCDPNLAWEWCGYADQLFVDDAPVRRVASPGDVVEGTFALDGSTGTLWLGLDPTGRRVEQSVPGAHAFVADAGQDTAGVVIAGLVIEKYGTAPQEAAIAAEDSNGGYWSLDDPGSGATGGWRVTGNDIRLNHGAGVFAGPGSVVEGNRLRRNGQLGAKAAGRGARIVGNDVSGNGWGGFDTRWEAGGMKIWNAADVTIAGNVVRANVGSGVWTDYVPGPVTIEENVVIANTGPGINVEMTADATVRANLVVGNDTDDRGDPGYMTGGIFVFAAPRTRVIDNVVRDNVGGVIALDQARGCITPNAQMQGACEPGTETGTIAGLVVRGNDITMTEGFSGVQLVASADHPPYAEQPVSWARAVLAPGAITWDANTYRGAGYDGGPGDDDEWSDWENRFVYAFPHGAQSDPDSIWSWTERRYVDFAEWRERSGFDAASVLEG